MSRVMPLSSAVLAVTAALTMVTFAIASAMAGPGFVLYLAMLGGAAAWLLPALVAQSLPCGILGGTLVAGAGSPSEHRPAAGAVVASTCLVTVMSLGLVGWLMPQGYQQTAARSNRFVNAKATARETAPVPSALELPQLMGYRSDGGRAELARRLQPVGLVFLLGLVAAGLVASQLAWTTTTALAATAVVYAMQMIYWVKSWP